MADPHRPGTGASSSAEPGSGDTGPPGQPAAAALSIGVFGLGEAGSLFAADLAAVGARVRGFDPADVATPAGVERCSAPEEAVEGADLVLAFVAERDMVTALTQAATSIASSTLYVDMGSGAPSRKRELHQLAARFGFELVDVDMMATVPGNGMRTPGLASGPQAERFVELVTPLGMRMQAVGTRPGDAAARKLLRSVVVKGLSALVVEAMRAGHAAGCADWLWENLVHQVEAADGAFLRHLVDGLARHHLRRTDEMAAAAELLHELGVPSPMTEATVAEFRLVPEGLPALPAPPDAGGHPVQGRAPHQPEGG